MVVRHTGKPSKVRAVYRLSGVSGPITFGVHNNNLANLRRGLMERVYNVETPCGLAPPPKPLPGVFSRLDSIKSAVVSYIGRAAPCSLDDFVQMYAGDRRMKVYREAADSLVHSPVTTRDAVLTTFVKAEKINLSKKPDPAPRVIQPRTPRFNAAVGCYLKRLEKDIYRALKAYTGDVVVMKGYNARESGDIFARKWAKFKRPCAIGLDASRFDQHVSEGALRWEHSVYLAVFKGADRSTLRELLEMQIHNRGVARASDGIIKYSVKGCRMSGDMNTALGNCLIMCAIVLALFQELGIQAELTNNGDDCVVILEERDRERFAAAVSQWFLDFGFTVKVEPAVYELEAVEFCQTHPVCVDGEWLMVRDSMTAMAKDAHSVLDLKDGMGPKWATAIGSCGMSLAGGVPIFQEFYSALLRVGGGATMGHHPALESGFARLASGMSRKYETVADSTRISFWKAFGILPSIQVAYEEQLRAFDTTWHITRRESTADSSFSLVLPH